MNRKGLVYNFIIFQLLLRNEIEAVDFKNAEKARTTINEWVELKTLKKIRDLIPTGVFDEGTKAVLVTTY